MIDTLYRTLRPALFRLDPERAHRLAVRALAAGLVGIRSGPEDPILRVRLWGREAPSPIGLAAGFDKHAECPGELLALGFGLVELGTVTPEPQIGNPTPRLFRLEEDRAVINRFGLNSVGLDTFVRRLAARRRRAGLVGANLGKNKSTAEDDDSDFVRCVEATAPFADYLVVNVSSPNTPGLRELQRRAAMERIVTAALAARDHAVPDPERRPALLVKLAPDLDRQGLEDAAAAAIATGLDGLVMGNTTVDRPADLRSLHRGEGGGLSGRPLRERSSRQLAALYRLVGPKVPIVACGGVESGADAYARIRAGAAAVQLYSALVYEGPGLVRRINRDLAALLRRDGFASVGEAVGADDR